MFQSIDKYSIGEIEVKKSRFIAEVFYVDNEENAKQKIDDIKKKYFDAKHHVFSFKIGNLERFSDDGEPQGTAGTPLLVSELYDTITITVGFASSLKLRFIF